MSFENYCGSDGIVEEWYQKASMVLLSEHQEGMELSQNLKLLLS